MKHKLTLFAFGCGLLVAPNAFAQTAPAEGAAASTLDEVVVTARRREESQQTVPISMVALSQNTLTAAQVHQPDQLGKVAPGLTVVAGSANPAIVDFAIRGRGLNFGSAAGSVETYFAEVPLSPPFQMPTLPVQLFDVESVQVLKGPQGTLFGRSTTGGAVVVQPHMPSNNFEGYGRGALGDYNAIQAEGAVNIPLVQDKLALRVSFLRNKRDGYITESPVDATGAVLYESRTGLPIRGFKGNNIDLWEARAILKFTPNEAFENTLLITYHHDKSIGIESPGLWKIFGPVTPEPGAGTYTAFSSVSPGDRPPNDAYAIVNTSSYDLTDNLKLRNIFGYVDARGHVLEGMDTDGTFIVAIDNMVSPASNINKQYTEELQLQGRAFDSRLDFTIGGLMDLTREPRGFGNLNHCCLSSVSAATITAAGIPLDTAHPHAASYRTRYFSQDITSYALYAAGSFKLTDQINVSGGYRHTWDTVEATQASSLSASSYVPEVYRDADPLVAGFQNTKEFKADFGSDVYNVGAEYHMTPDVMLYAGFRHGFKRGGFNASAIPPAPADFAPEEINSFSLGAKTEFHVGGMYGRFNAEGFYDKYTGFQATILQFAAGNLITVTTNIPRVRYQGVDLSLNLRPAELIDLDFSYSYLDPKITDFPDPTSPAHTQLTSNEVPFAPKHQLYAAVRFHGEMPNNLGEWAIRPSVSYSSEWYTTTFNRLQPAGQTALFGAFNQIANGGGTVEAHTLVDLRMEWNKINGSRVNLALQATNLTNKYYTLGNSGTLNFGFQSDAVGPPRMVMAEVSVDF